MKEEIILRKDRTGYGNVTRFLTALPTNRAYRVEISEYKPRRTDQQNRYLRACYRVMLAKGGEALAGWTADDLHEYFLGEHFGLQHLMIGGSSYERPLQRSSKLNKQDFSDFIASIQRRAAELGIYIPDPEEYLTP